MNLNKNNYAKLKSNLRHDQEHYETNYQFVNINLNVKILYILAQKQRNNGSHMSHTKKKIMFIKKVLHVIKYHTIVTTMQSLKKQRPKYQRCTKGNHKAFGLPEEMAAYSIFSTLSFTQK